MCLRVRHDLLVVTSLALRPFVTLSVPFVHMEAEALQWLDLLTDATFRLHIIGHPISSLAVLLEPVEKLGFYRRDAW